MLCDWYNTSAVVSQSLEERVNPGMKVGTHSTKIYTRHIQLQDSKHYKYIHTDLQ
jgi:hypothetical protein